MSKTITKKGTAAKEAAHPLNISAVILLIAYGYITVLTPNLYTLDSNGPKFLTLSLLNIITFAFLFTRKEVKTTPVIFSSFFSNGIGLAYTFLMVFSLLSFLNAFNKPEALLHFAKLFTTFSATYLVTVLFLLEKRSILYLSVAMTLLLAFDSVTVYSEIGKYIDGKTKDIGEIKTIYSNKNILSASIFVKLAFSLWLFITGHKWMKYLGGITTFLAMIAVFFLSTRAFYLGLILLSLTLILFFAWRYLLDRKISGLKTLGLYLVMLLLSFLIFSFVQVNLYPKKKNQQSLSVAARLSTITEKSGGGRYDGWVRSWHVFQEHPLLGVGVGNWKIATLKEENLKKGDFTYQYKAHNDFIETAAEAGIFAVICLALIFVLTAWKFLQLLMKNAPPATLDIFLLPTIGLLGYFMDASFNFPQDRPEIQALFALFTGMAIAVTTRTPGMTGEISPEEKQEETLSLDVPFIRKFLKSLHEDHNSSEKRAMFVYRGVTWLFLILLLGSSYLMYLNFRSLRLQRIIKQEINKGVLTSPADLFLKEFPGIPNLNVVGEPIAAQKARYLIHEKRYDEAISLLKNDHSSPYDTRPEYFLAMAYYEKGMTDSAIYYSQRVYEMKPRHFKNISILTNTLMGTGKQKEAEAILDKYMVQSRKEKDACLYASSFYDKTGSIDKAVKIMDSAVVWFPKDTTIARQKSFIQRRLVLSTSKPVLDAAVGAYFSQKYAEAIPLLSQLLVKYPSFPDAREYRAFSYFFLKDYTRSIEDVNALLAQGIKRPNLFNLLGVNYYNLGKKEEACTHFKTARDLGDKDGNENYIRFCQTVK